MGVMPKNYVRRLGTGIYLEPLYSAYPQVKLITNSYIALIAHASSNIRIQKGTTPILRVDHATNVTTIEGGGVTGDDLQLKCNTIDARPLIHQYGAGGTIIDQTAGSALEFGDGGTVIGNIVAGGGGVGGAIHLKETTTPTAVPDFGAIYTKNDNHLYWQSGAGVEYDLGGA